MMRVPRDVSKRGTSVADRGPVKLGNPVSLMHCVMHPKFNDKTSYAPVIARIPLLPSGPGGVFQDNAT